VSNGSIGVGVAGLVADLAFFLLPGGSVAAAAFPVEASAENGDDREDVVGEFALWSGGVLVVFVHDDICSVLFKYELDKLVPETAEAVFVGNVHCA